MKVLEANRQIFLKMWFHETPNSDGKWIQLRNFLSGWTCFLAMTSIVTFSASYLVANPHTDLENYIYVTFQMSVCGSQVYLMLFAFLTRPKFVKMFIKMQEVYDKCNSNSI